MRDINRIDTFLARLGEFWKQYPDLRFGQMISLIQIYGPVDDFYYFEDDYLLEILNRIDDHVKEVQTH